MGFLDKAKHFLGKHGLAAAHTSIEGQYDLPELYAGDTIVKGNFAVTSDKTNLVTSTRSEFCMSWIGADDTEQTLLLGKDVYPADHVSRSDDMLQYPFTINSGETIEDGFCIMMDMNIPNALKLKNVPLEKAQFYVMTMVDVKGSPFDPETKTVIKVVEGERSSRIS